MTIDLSSIHRILLIKLRGIGDVLLSTVVIRNLACEFPEARLEFLTEPPAADVLRGNDDLDEVLLFDRHTISSTGLIRMVRARKYDLVIDLFGNPRTALVTRLSRARYRVGYRFRGRRYAYNIVTEPRGGEVHNTQFNLDAIERIGVAIQDRNLYFPVPAGDLEFADRFMASSELSGKRVAAISASGGWYTKRWGKERFAELADRLIGQHQCAVLLLWGPGEDQEAANIQAVMREPAHLAPPTTLKQLGALLSRCSFMVSNDSGPMHIATAVGTPVLGIYGPTNPMLQGPYGKHHQVIRNEDVSCLGCNLTECPIGHPCMLELRVDRVEEAAVRLMAEIDRRT
ncbi:MAG: glycosyltransferase family 9 protein [Ignavibacteria bacterium]|nr:glycosyltransferase family 9 protein [Ignavibacteria bacterium]